MAYDAQHGVNVAECLALADFLEALPPEQFNMSGYGAERSCGTVACVAGWAAIQTGCEIKDWSNGDSPSPFNENSRNVEAVAGRALSINDDQAQELFRPIGWRDVYFSNVVAARVLRHLAATGQVDWSVALAEAA